MKKNAVIFFTRIPVPGKTKTRLHPFLTEDECCRLHRAFVQDVYGVLSRVDADCDILVYCTGEGGLADLKALLPDSRTFFPQHGQTLGEKMHNAICRVLESGYERCLLVGSDLPLLRAKAVEDAFRFLDGEDIVLCPTEDGGYYLVGMKEPCENIFGQEYGGSSVFAGTLALVAESGKSCAVGETTMDIDYPEDLFRLAQRLETESPEICPKTREVLKSFAAMKCKMEGKGEH